MESSELVQKPINSDKELWAPPPPPSRSPHGVTWLSDLAVAWHRVTRLYVMEEEDQMDLWRKAGSKIKPLEQCPVSRGKGAGPDLSLFTSETLFQCHPFLARNYFQEPELWEFIGLFSERVFYSIQ